jgi:hypothetical protein
MAVQMIEIESNVIRFPRELRCLDLDALIAVEPDIMLADSMSERFDLDTLPFDLIDCAEHDARARIAEMSDANLPAFHAALRLMSEQAFAAAISLCLQARKATDQAALLRRNADTALARKSRNHQPLDFIAEAAERSAAIATLAALAEAHRARGIDAAVSLKHAGIDDGFPFGLVGMY